MGERNKVVIIHSPPVKNEPSVRNGVSLENGSIR